MFLKNAKDGNILEVFETNSNFKDKKIWMTYSLWQFGCEMSCCEETNDENSTKKPCFYKIDKLECGIDYNIYNGNEKELVKN